MMSTPQKHSFNRPAMPLNQFFYARYFSTNANPAAAAAATTTTSQSAAAAAAQERVAQVASSAQAKMYQHEGVQQYGPETWERLVKIATERANAYLACMEAADNRASGSDTAKSTWFGQRLRPANLHKQYKDLSHLSGEERFHHFQQLWNSACDFRPRMFPKPRAVNNWLSFLILLVMTMVSVGGVTRLTRSGLSMTHWKFTGEKRPSTPEEWQEEFEIYKKSPEWRLHNQEMTVDEFKYIYNWEYGHRTLGRSIGVAFVVPLVYFLARGRLSLKEPFGKALLGTLSLGGVQGLIGWWMVKSGLNEEDNQVKARVSPYRLATHLIIAFTLLIGLTTLKLRAKHGKVDTFFDGQLLSPKQNFMGYYLPRKLAHALATLSFITAMSGAFVAGNDAGMVYNEWPTMGGPGNFIPSDLFNPNMSIIQNTFENPTFVQFTHRCLAYTTFGTAWVAALRCLFNRQCPGIVAKSAFACATMASIQATLGVATLMNEVPVDLAACHQGGAMLLLMASTRFMYYTNNPICEIGPIGHSLASNLSLYRNLASKVTQTKPIPMSAIGELAQQVPAQAHIEAQTMANQGIQSIAAQAAKNGALKSSAFGLLAFSGMSMGFGGLLAIKQQQQKQEKPFDFLKL